MEKVTSRQTDAQTEMTGTVQNTGCHITSWSFTNCVQTCGVIRLALTVSSQLYFQCHHTRTYSVITLALTVSSRSHFQCQHACTDRVSTRTQRYDENGQQPHDIINMITATHVTCFFDMSPIHKTCLRHFVRLSGLLFSRPFMSDSFQTNKMTK